MIKVFEKEFIVKTKDKIELGNLTLKIEEIIRNFKIAKGLLTIFLTHTSAALLINENEPGLKKDFIFAQKMLIRYKKLMRLLQHNRLDQNAAAHLTAGALGVSLSLIIRAHKLVLGTWQQIFLFELDGPRERKINLQIIGQ